MGSRLPELAHEEFVRRLRAVSPRPLTPTAETALYRHYVELRRWNPRLSLVGPGTAGEVVERHFGESLAALPLVPAGGRVLDIGAGAGFPGLVLAAADPGLEVVLVEARERKWAFLEAVRRAASLSCTCLNARVGAALDAVLPTPVDVVTLRALRLPPAVLAELARRLRPGGAILFWSGESDPVLPPTLRLAAVHPLPGRHRRLLVARPVEPPANAGGAEAGR